MPLSKPHAQTTVTVGPSFFTDLSLQDGHRSTTAIVTSAAYKLYIFLASEVVLLTAEPLPTGPGCLCKIAHSATRRDVASVFLFLLGTRGTQPIVCRM